MNKESKEYYGDFFYHTGNSFLGLDMHEIEHVVDILVGLRGRLFVIGSGGGAGHASHAAADFRNLCRIDAIAVYDNVSSLTALTNDYSYDLSIREYMKISKFDGNDCLFVFSVGGGTDEVSKNIVNAIIYAKESEAKIIGIVGRDGGKTKELADATILIKPSPGKFLTPITEGLQSLIWHMIITHPKLSKTQTKW